MRNDIALLKSLMTTHTLAQEYAITAASVEHCKTLLEGAYEYWRAINGRHDFIERNSADWKAMMAYTAEQYRDLQNTKARKRRAEKKLLQAVAGGQQP